MRTEHPKALNWDQKAAFPEGTLVCLKTGGPLMTTEETRSDGIVATVWFVAGIVYRDAFHPKHLNAFIPRPE